MANRAVGGTNAISVDARAISLTRTSSTLPITPSLLPGLEDMLRALPPMPSDGVAAPWGLPFSGRVAVNCANISAFVRLGSKSVQYIVIRFGVSPLVGLLQIGRAHV